MSSFFATIEGWWDSVDAVGDTAATLAANDHSQVTGVWIDTTTRITAQSAPALSDAIEKGMAKRGYEVQQIRVPSSEGPIRVALKVGLLPVGVDGVADPQAATQALTDIIAGLPYTGLGAVETGANEVYQQVVKPTIEPVGIGIGVILLIGGALYLALLVR
jgi:hypothetical protein